MILSTATLITPDANVFPGVVYTILFLATIMALPLCFLIIHRYKKAVIKGMGYKAQHFTHQDGITPQEEIKNQEALIRIIPVSTLSDKSSKVFFKLKETLGWHWIIYGVMCFAFAGFTAWCSLQTMGSIGFWRFSYTSLIYWLPFLPISFIILVNGWKQMLMISTLVLFLIIASTYIIWAEAAINNMRFSDALKPFITTNIIPFSLLALFRIPRIKSIGVMVFAFFIISMAGPALFYYYLSSHPKALEKIGYLFIDAGINTTLTFVIWFTIPFLFSALLGWISFKQIKKAYQRKWVNDLQMQADAVVLLFNLTYCISISFSSIPLALLSLLAFPIFKITGAGLFFLLRKNKIKQNSPRLLLLRVFALADDSRSFFERILKHWRYAGSVQMISGPDLATSSLEPHELINFIGGSISESFCDDEASIIQNIKLADNKPDSDSTHRVNEFFCRDNNWKFVLRKLVNESEVILMDLRSFSSKFQGCRYEIESLVNWVNLEKVIFVVDGKTDIPFTQETFKRAYAQASSNSINIQQQIPVTLYQINSSRDQDVYKILNALCSKLEN